MRLAGMAFALLVGILLARALGPAGYGIYGAAMAVLALLSVAAEAGTPRMVTREVASAETKEDWEHLRGVLFWARRLALFASASIFAVVLGWAILLGDWNSPVLLTILIGLPLIAFMALGNVASAGLNGLHRLLQGQLADVILRPALFALLLALALLTLPNGLDPVSAMACGVASAGIAYVAAAMMLRRALPPAARSATRRIAPHWLASAINIALSDAVRVGQLQLGVLITIAIAGAEVAGFYRVAASLYVVVALPEALFNMIGAPVLAKLLASGDAERLQRVLAWVAAASLGATLLAVAPLLFWSEDIAILLLGREFAAAGLPLAVLGVGCLITTALGPSLILLSVGGRDRDVAWCGAAAILLLVAASVPLVTAWGAPGAALGYAISFFAWRLLMWHRARRTLDFDSSIISFIRLYAPKGPGAAGRVR